ncbi:MAG: hypothetical protein ACYT04_54490, partial [Nostoc sp.]
MLRLKGYVLFLCFFLALSVSVILGSMNFVQAIDSRNPKLPKLNTLYGQPPIVIGHRGGGT